MKASEWRETSISVLGLRHICARGTCHCDTKLKSESDIDIEAIHRPSASIVFRRATLQLWMGTRCTVSYQGHVRVTAVTVRLVARGCVCKAPCIPCVHMRTTIRTALIGYSLPRQSFSANININTRLPRNDIHGTSFDGQMPIACHCVGRVC